MAAPIGIEVVGHVAVIEMQAPPHNFLTPTLVEGVAEALESFDDDAHVRAAVLCAQGRSFCAGANFGGDDGPLGPGSGAEPVGGSVTERMYAAAARLCEVATPFVAAVHGPAIGGGLGLAMTANLRVTCPEARFSANFAALGLHQGFGLSVLLPEVLGTTRAAEVLLTATRYDGESATALGMADRCVPLDDVRATAVDLAAQIAVNAPLALRSINRTLRAGLADRVRAATAHEAEQQRILSSTADAAEGIRAVTERRPGNFTGS
ncbi:enoyl-CoA hydratase/isomerase family protein [Actinomarinicola tropica]|uniref:Enoyl-CoA hydratase/isomerase family protein n=1 Tax=Actinomarinicola tropica TaxID=2789776 RepID=A0A5Q2RHM3_9ACTN|nr:enoyl-CoA hydratase/isomerase family protein [Actinomarinicola tropica]QGG95084.1 enoyl-CoA hydratase/isomerase family protein [Actinomarinicola tropica]